MVEKDDKIRIVMNFVSDKNDNGVTPIISDCSGFYEKNIDKIAQLFEIPSQKKILPIIYALKKTNAFTLMKITNYSYPVIYNNLLNLQQYKIITLIKGKSGKQKMEISVELNPHVEIIPYYEAREIFHKKIEQLSKQSIEFERQYFLWLKQMLGKEYQIKLGQGKSDIEIITPNNEKIELNLKLKKP